ncbi:hypothetical protein CTRI78_v004123 [Colletotrichum trifolii]|uniref:Uncharacterized protein n=1 Tax=Colletotrichum trifolii TaxID=5466 RepID=A0A4R8RUF4_COLTR|nr:hypothetical protein CTRI78_v004123 [Colletotrichum trifolii]
MVPLIVTLTYLLAAVTLASPVNPPGLAQDLTTSLLTRRDGPTYTYTAVTNAAASAGVRLRDGEWHYLRLCTPLEGHIPKDDVQRETGCKHFYLVVGKVIIKNGFFSGNKRDFQGSVYHVRNDEDDRKWYWKSHPYGAYGYQDILYGGRTTSTKASSSRLDALSTAWVEKWGTYCDQNEARCFGYYHYMTSLL